MVESMGLNVPKKPTVMSEFWPVHGKKEFLKHGLVFLQYRDIAIGPFPNRTEAHWYDGQVQDVIMGWNNQRFFAGRVFPYGDGWYVDRWDTNWYVERWDTNDGPFNFNEAVDHRQKLYDAYNKNGEEVWARKFHTLGLDPDASVDMPHKAGPVFDDEPKDEVTYVDFDDIKEKAGYAIRGGIKWGPISESGRVQVTEDGKVKIGEKVTSEEPVKDLERQHKDSGLWQKAKKAVDDEFVDNSVRYLADPHMNVADSMKKSSDDIMDVSFKFDKDKFLDGLIGPTQDTDGYCGYVVSERTGIVHIDPSTGRMHQKDHICNQKCRDLATRAQVEFLRDEEAAEKAKSEEPQSQVLYQNDVPVILGIMMKRFGAEHFHFTATDLREFNETVRIEEDKRGYNYVIRRGQ